MLPDPLVLLMANIILRNGLGRVVRASSFGTPSKTVPSISLSEPTTGMPETLELCVKVPGDPAHTLVARHADMRLSLWPLTLSQRLPVPMQALLPASGRVDFHTVIHPAGFAFSAFRRSSVLHESWIAQMLLLYCQNFWLPSFHRIVCYYKSLQEQHVLRRLRVVFSVSILLPKALYYHLSEI